MKTHVALVLDRSGSMKKTLNETITGFNEQLATLRDTGHEVGVTFTVFGSTVDIRSVDQPINEVAELTEKTYVPIGWTSLYDAVGQTIIKLEDEVVAAEDDAFLVMVFSDGQENNSKEYTSETLAAVIKRLQETGKWTFSYMGSNQDLGQVAATLNIPVGNLCSYTQDSAGTTKAFAKFRRDTTKYFAARSTGATSVDCLYNDGGDQIATSDND